MVPKEFLLIAGNGESDTFGAALVRTLREGLTTAETGYDEGLQPLHASLEPRFYGMGGPQMAEAGVEMACQTEALEAAERHSFRHPLLFRQVFERVYRVALDREPQAVVGIGFLEFNVRLARAIRRYVRHERGTFKNWDPLVIQVGLARDGNARVSRERNPGNEVDRFLSAAPPERFKHPEDRPHQRVEWIGPLNSPDEVSEAARRAAQAIIRALWESKARFPLRAYLSAD